MKNVSTEAIVGSIVILALVIAAFLWVMLKPETQTKYNPPYKYYSGDRPEHSRK